MSYTHGLDQRTGDLIKNKFTYRVENFIPPGQLKLINSYTRGEEGSYYKDFLDELEKVVGEMPIAREESHTTDTVVRPRHTSSTSISQPIRDGMYSIGIVRMNRYKRSGHILMIWARVGG